MSESGEALWNCPICGGPMSESVCDGFYAQIPHDPTPCDPAATNTKDTPND